jgi:hypothetical protein
MRLCSVASIFAARPFDHSSVSALLRKVLITIKCKLLADTVWLRFAKISLVEASSLAAPPILPSSSAIKLISSRSWSISSVCFLFGLFGPLTLAKTDPPVSRHLRPRYVRA